MVNKIEYNGSTRITTERAKRDKIIVEREHKTSAVFGKINWKLSIKIFADLNEIRFNKDYKKLTLTAVLLIQNILKDENNVKKSEIENKDVVLDLYC